MAKPHIYVYADHHNFFTTLNHPYQSVFEISRIKSLLPAFGALNEREEEQDEQEAKEDEEVIQHIWALSLKKSDMTIYDDLAFCC